ncbi:MAG: zf-HC2 domain-containing protein [Gammaproteobacteria bacterium]
MNADHIDNQLDAYLDGDLPEEARQGITEHVHQCERCQQQLAEAESLQAQLAALPVEGPAADFFTQALANAAKQDRRAPMNRWVKNMGGAIAAGVVILVVVGLLGRNPTPEITPQLQGVTMALHESRTLNLVFSSAEALEGAQLVVELPLGLELDAYPGEQRIRWKTSLQAGRNLLPLDLIAVAGSGGEVVAYLEHGDKSKTFRLRVHVTDATSFLIDEKPKPGQA